ncbi:Regulator of G-protein signaling 9, partial [Varanus komodoensis]
MEKGQSRQLVRISNNPFARKQLRSSPSPVILRQLEEEAKAKEAATNVDITQQLCQFTTPVSHLTVYTGTSDPPSPSRTLPSSCHAFQCSGHIPLPNSTSCYSVINVGLDSTSVLDRSWDNHESSSNVFPSIMERVENSMDSESGTCSSSHFPMNSETKLLPKSRMNLSLSRFLKRGYLNSPVFATLSPKCPAVSHVKVQPVDDLNQPLKQKSKKIKVDAPFESKIYPILSEEKDVTSHWVYKDSAKEVICPWEKLAEEGQ